MPAPGRGLVAGSALRDVLELGGVHDVVGKIFSGSKNKLNIARATIKALSTLRTGNSYESTNTPPQPFPRKGKESESRVSSAS